MSKYFVQKPYQNLLGLSLKAEDYQYLTKLWNISPKTFVLVKYCYYMYKKLKALCI